MAKAWLLPTLMGFGCMFTLQILPPRSPVAPRCEARVMGLSRFPWLYFKSTRWQCAVKIPSQQDAFLSLGETHPEPEALLSLVYLKVMNSHRISCCVVSVLTGLKAYTAQCVLAKVFGISLWDSYWYSANLLHSDCSLPCFSLYVRLLQALLRLSQTLDVMLLSCIILPSVELV